MNNIGYLKNKNGKLKKYPNFEYGLIEYFYNLNKTDKKLRNEKYVPYKGSAKYVEDLIIYYSSIYSKVNAQTLLGIGAAESGYYKVKFMLKYNNVFGGMSANHKLIKYNNIELGVLTYVRMMSNNYYGEGLTSLEAIGKKYCPVYENGEKKASSHWLQLVKTTKKQYKNYSKTITLNDIIGKEEI